MTRYRARASGEADIKMGDKIYRAEYEADGSGCFIPGDWNNPSDGDFEITDIDAVWYDITETEDNPPEVEETGSMYAYLEEYLYANDDLWDIDYDYD